MVDDPTDPTKTMPLAGRITEDQPAGESSKPLPFEAFDFQDKYPPVKCTLCGTVWNRAAEAQSCHHTEAEWEKYREGLGIAAGELYARYAMVDDKRPPVPPIDPNFRR
jgi:hypothetical protein